MAIKKKQKLGTRLESLEDLKKQSKGKALECFITLNGGARSSKNIEYFEHTNSFAVFHNIDDELEMLSEKQFTNSFTGKALIVGALYKYN